jgi:hypothetical protein
MARKSGWQQFTDNFNSVYNTFTDVAKDVETNKIMKQEEFLGADNKPLAGIDRDRARMRALADVYTKYGDVEGGLKIRSDLAAAEKAERDTEIQRQTMQGLIDRVELQNRLIGAETNNQNASAASGFALANQRNTLTPFMADQYRLGNEVTQQAIDFTKATQPSAIDAEISGNRLKVDENTTELALSTDKLETRVAELAAQAEQFRLDKNQAGLRNLETEALQDYANAYQAGEFKSGKEAAEAFISLYGAFDLNKALDLNSRYESEEIASIANEGLKIQADVNRLVQDGNIDGLVAYFDERNGADIGIQFKEQGDGGYLIQETKDGKVIGTLLSANTRAEFNEGVQALASFGNATSYAELLFRRENDQRKTDSDILTALGNRDLNEQQTALIREKIETAQQERLTGLGAGDREKLFVQESADFLQNYLIANPDGRGLDKAYADFIRLFNNNQFEIIKTE